MLTGLAFDIKGAFDRVVEEKLTYRLWEQGIPLTLIRWVSFFLKDRKAAIRLDGQTGEQEPVQIGVPQGSPAAPILFILFTASLFKLFFHENKKPGLAIRGYVDDGLITACAQTEKDSVSKIQNTFLEVGRWAYENGMVFDPAKFEAIHFSRKGQFDNPDIQLLPPPFVSDVTEPRIVKPVTKNKSMRW